MEILDDIKAKLTLLNEEEADIIQKQKELDMQLKELRIKKAAYKELVESYLEGVSSRQEAYRQELEAKPEPVYVPSSYGQPPAYARQPSPPQQAYSPQGYPSAPAAPVAAYGESQQEPRPVQQTYSQPPQAMPNQAYPQQYAQQEYADNVYSSQASYAPSMRAMDSKITRPVVQAPRKSSASRAPKRMSSQKTAEIWMAVREILSDGSSWQVGDLRHELERRMDLGEINRTTLQSILKRNEDDLDRSEKGYVRLKSAR